MRGFSLKLLEHSIVFSSTFRLGWQRSHFPAFCSSWSTTVAAVLQSSRALASNPVAGVSLP